MIKIEECPTCGSAKIRLVRRNLVRERDGNRYVVPRVEFYHCPDCDEKVYPPESVRRIQGNFPTVSASRPAR